VPQFQATSLPMRAPVKKRVPNHSLNMSAEEGFAVPLAIGMGAIVLLVGLTMIMRSQNDRVIATEQAQNARSYAVAEGGMARSLGYLNGNYQPFLQYSYDPINPATGKTYLGLDGVSNNGDEETAAVDQWTNLPNPPPCFDSSNFSSIFLQGIIGSGSTNNYRLLAYRYSSGQGTLLVKGSEVNPKATTILQQKMAIQPQIANTAANFPGLLATDINLDNNDVLGTVSGNVICTSLANCPIPNNSTSCVNGQPTLNALLGAIGAGPNGVVQGRIYVRSVTWPPLPTAPAGTYSLGNIADNMILPRPGDTPDANGKYSYSVSNIQLSGNKTLTINTTGTPPTPVNLFVSGDITISGSAQISHASSDAGNFRIYGNPMDPGNNTPDQTFVLNGGASSTNLFIYAPDANVGINGGSSDPDISGAVWAKTWHLSVGSSSNNAEISVPDDMPQQVSDLYNNNFVIGNQTASVTTWQKRPDPEAN
jgi:hypothetical protein